MTAPASVKSVLLKFLENLILLRDNDELAACTRAEKRHRAKPIKDGGNNERELSTRQRQSLLERTGVWGKLLKHFEEAVRTPTSPRVPNEDVGRLPYVVDACTPIAWAALPRRCRC